MSEHQAETAHLLGLPNCQITYPDFCLWGYIKNKVLATKVTKVEDLKTWIWDVTTTINWGIKAHTWEEQEFRLYVLFAT
jgi:N6-adenosine-specific RNA methylase IME4